MFFTKRDKTELLQKKSKNIISVFTRTVEELKVVNQEIDETVKEKQAIMLQLQQESFALDMTKAGNEKIISNIEKILQ